MRCFRGVFMHRKGVSSRNSEFRSKIIFSAGFQVGPGPAAARCVPKSKNSDVGGGFQKASAFMARRFRKYAMQFPGCFYA